MPLDVPKGLELSIAPCFMHQLPSPLLERAPSSVYTIAQPFPHDTARRFG